MTIRVTPDYQKAAALRRMARITQERLNETDMMRYPSNTLTDYYDILHKLLEARAPEHGMKSKGEGAHQELIECIAQEVGLTEKKRTFLQQMRDYRNRVAYEGFTIRTHFISQNKGLIEEIIHDLSG